MTGKIKLFIFGTLFILTIITIESCKKADLITTPTVETCDTVNLTYIDYFPNWSPDGSKIVFFNNGTNGSTCGIYSIDTNGTNKNLLKADCSARNPVWSQDGNWITYETANLLFKIASTGGVAIQITNIASYYPSWGKDNRWIAFDSNDSLHYY